MSGDLHERARRVRSRAAVRAWEYRQRRHSKGMWFRLRRVLAYAESVFAISSSDADRLEEEGYCCESVGAEMAPAKRMLFVPAERLKLIRDKRELPVRLSAELLETRCVALVAFEHADPHKLEAEG